MSHVDLPGFFLLKWIRNYLIPPPPPELARYRITTPPPHRWQVPSHTKPGVTYTVTQRPKVYAEPEVSYHRAGLSEALGRLDDRAIVGEEAVKWPSHCAHLIRDGSLRYTGEADVVNVGVPNEMGHVVLGRLVRAAIGKSPGSCRVRTTIPLGDGGDVLDRVSLIMGVFLELDREGRLVSMSIEPARLKKRPKLMAFVGASNDPEPDVVQRHDEYLGMQDSDGRN